MPLRYQLLPEHRLLFGIFYGTLTPEEYLRGIDELSQNPAFAPDFDRLGVYHDSLDLSLFSMDDILAIKEHMIEAYYDDANPATSATSSYRIAVVSKPSINEAMLKLYAATLTSDKLPTVSVETFARLDQALRWLGHDALIEEFQKPQWVEFLTVAP